MTVRKRKATQNHHQEWKVVDSCTLLLTVEQQTTLTAAVDIMDVDIDVDIIAMDLSILISISPSSSYLYTIDHVRARHRGVAIPLPDTTKSWHGSWGPWTSVHPMHYQKKVSNYHCSSLIPRATYDYFWTLSDFPSELNPIIHFFSTSTRPVMYIARLMLVPSQDRDVK